MRFRILGSLEVLSPDGWAAINAAKWRSLLAVLLLRHGQLVPTETLIDELWGDNPPGTANNLVSIYVHRLRKVIDDPEGRTLLYRKPGYLLRVAPDDLDLGHFEALAAEGRDVLASGQQERAAELLGQALGLWRGPLLADVPPSPSIDRYARPAVEQWLSTTELRIEADLGCGRAARVIPELRGLVTQHPLRERLWALLVRALEESGRRAEALDAYAQARAVIADELGVDPGAELQRLYTELLAADTRPPGPGPAPPAAVPELPASRPLTPGPGTHGRPDVATPADDDAGPADTGETDNEPPGGIAIGTLAELAPAEILPVALGETAGPERGIPRPAQLPADIGDFTGREKYVDYLCGLLVSSAVSSPGAVRIAVVNGTGGLGKTTLAVHAAHQVSAQFPDGQLYVDLLGASSQPLVASEVLARFLRDLGLEGDRVPVGDEERSALYRSILTGRRVLILLDNARDAAQIRPLLPGSSSCAVLATTRNRISDLASTRFVDLNVLEDTDALALFSRIVGEERAAAEPDATAEVLVACAGLPLAIRICAARLAARGKWQIATLAARLRNSRKRLDELKTGDLAVRASFQVSYDSLKPANGGVSPAYVFRLLGLWTGASISLAAAAALLGVPEDDAAVALEGLVDVTLLESPAPDWYGFHDLLREYATERAEEEEPAAVREEAVGRLLWWYLDSAEAAANAVSPQRYQVPRETVPAVPGWPPLALAGRDEALEWYDDERANVVSATRLAAAAGLHEVAWRLPPTLAPVFNRRSNWADCVTAHRAGLESARISGSQVGEAWVLNSIGFALVRLRDAEGLDRLEQALRIRRELGDSRGEAQTAIGLGAGYLSRQGPGEDALRYMRLAVELLRPAHAGSMLAVALNNLGEVYFELGDLRAAEDCYVEARDTSWGTGEPVEGHAVHNLGRVYRLLRRLDEAAANFEEARGKHHASGELFGEAMSLRELGQVHSETGKRDNARESLTAALRIFERIGDPDEASKTSALLASLDAGEP